MLDLQTENNLILTWNCFWTSMIFHILLITILRLIQNDLSGKGILSLSTDLLNVTWAYFFFQPNSTSLEIQVCILLSGEN